ncbi:MAG: hypothetical protein EOO24_02125 [Comamonadaceae bacterium]|nr:MAG: hypothetical protein EOO24_02125 [Comamonadaceae bacterium]
MCPYAAPPPPPHREEGQATLLAMGALLFLVTMTLAAFNVGQASYGKIKTLNAADGAAYAAANTLARDMNFMAYSNRAMVANHVAVGQMVSLASLSKELGVLTQELSTGSKVVGVLTSWLGVGEALIALGNALQQVKSSVLDKVPALVKPLIGIEEGIITVLQASQPLMRSVTVLDAQDNVRKTVRANDPAMRWDTSSAGGALSTAASLNAFIGYSGPQGSGKAPLDRFRQVTMDSRDKLTRERKWLFGLSRGGTELRDNNNTWTGLDGALLDLWLVTVPVAWGGAQAGPDKAWRPGSYGGIRSKVANTGYAVRDKLPGYNGLRSYFDIHSRAKDDSKSQSGAIVVIVTKPLDTAGDLKTQTSDVALGTGAADNPYRLPLTKSSVMSIAASQVYFKRPARSQESGTGVSHLLSKYASSYPNGEYASLFSPYWQARLTEVPAGVNAAVQALY